MEEYLEKRKGQVQNIADLEGGSMVYLGLLRKMSAIHRAFKPSTGYLLLFIYAYYEEFQESMPGDDTILGLALDMKGRTIRDALKTLKEEGLIEVSKAKGERKIKPNFNYVLSSSLEELLVNTFKIARGEVRVSNTMPCDPIAIEVVKYWNSKKELIPVAIPLSHGTDIYETTEPFMKLMKRIGVFMSGKMFNNYKDMRFWHDKTWPLDEIKTSIDNFHLAATDTDYLPYDKTGKKKWRLFDFFFCPFASKQKSPVLEYQEKPKFAKIKKEVAQSISLYISLRDEMVSTYPGDLSYVQQFKLVAASNRMNEWVQKHKKYLPSMPMANQWASYVLEALIELIQKRGQATYDRFETLNQIWFWDYFTQFMQKKGLLSTYNIKR